MNSDKPQGRPSSFNPYVHGARGLFSAMVFVFHVANSGLPTFSYPGAHAVQFFLLSFKFGVELFFGISGIVILGALSRARSLPTFAWDRFTRIYPVLWATLIVVLSLSLVLRSPLPSAGVIALNFLIPPPGVVVPLLNPPAWSLSFELGFYLLCALAWLLRTRPGIVPVTAILGVVLIAIFPRTLLMLPGVLIGIGLLRWRVTRWLSHFPALMMCLFLLLWQAIETHHGAQTGSISPIILPVRDWLPYVPFILLAGVLGSAALLGIAEGHGVLGRVLSTRGAQWMGTISYSFYLWHPIALEAAKRLLIVTGVLPRLGALTQVVIFVVGLSLALFVAWASQEVIEKRFTRWLRRRVERPADAHVPITAAPPLSGDRGASGTLSKADGR